VGKIAISCKNAITTHYILLLQNLPIFFLY